MKIFLCLAVAAALACSTASAGPPFHPRAALDWCVDTVVSPVPLAKRVYVLGPDKTKEAYGLNGGIAFHDLETRQAVEYSEGVTLSELFRSLPKYSGELSVFVWRIVPDRALANEEKPLLSTPISEALVSKMTLRPDDIIEIVRPVSGFQVSR